MQRYIGLDVHASSCAAAIVDGKGKVIGKHIIETNGASLVEFAKIQPGSVHLCLEETTQSAWIVEILSPFVERIVVTMPKMKRGQKSDISDALGLAEQLRRGAVDVNIYKNQGSFGKLRQLVKTHSALSADLTRVQNRIKALFRSRGIPTPGKDVYNKLQRDLWLAQLPKTIRNSAEVQFEQYDALIPVKNRAKKELKRESNRFPITKKLATAPGFGDIRVAQLVSIVVTPHRFRTRRQFWSYCGLGVVMRSSSDYEQLPNGNWIKVEKAVTRGLNRNFNRMLKDVYKGAATTVIQQGGDEPVYIYYLRLMKEGTKPNIAKVALARKIASITLAMWKNEEVYNR